MRTPTEASGKYFITLRNDSDKEEKVFSFPRPQGQYFQKLEVYDGQNRMLEILKEADPMCKKGYVCVLLNPPLQPKEQRTIVAKYSFVPNPKMEGWFIKGSRITLPIPVCVNSSSYLHVLPPNDMIFSPRFDITFFPTIPLPSMPTAMDFHKIATPEMGSRYISLRFEPGMDGFYYISIKIEYPKTLCALLLPIPFIVLILTFYNLILRFSPFLFQMNLPLVPPQLFLALFAALFGVRIWKFNERLMKNLSYLYLFTMALTILMVILS